MRNRFLRSSDFDGAHDELAARDPAQPPKQRSLHRRRHPAFEKRNRNRTFLPSKEMSGKFALRKIQKIASP